MLLFAYFWTMNPLQTAPMKVKEDWEKKIQDIVLKTDSVRHSEKKIRNLQNVETSLSYKIVSYIIVEQ